MYSVNDNTEYDINVQNRMAAALKKGNICTQGVLNLAGNQNWYSVIVGILQQYIHNEIRMFLIYIVHLPTCVAKPSFYDEHTRTTQRLMRMFGIGTL